MYDAIPFVLQVMKSYLGCKIYDISKIELGVMNLKYKVSTSVGIYLFRIYLIDGDNKVSYEPDLFVRLAQLGVRTPLVVFDSRSFVTSVYKFVVYEWIDGSTLANNLAEGMSPKREATISNQLVSYIECAENLEINGFGNLVNTATARFASYRTFIEDSCWSGFEKLREYYSDVKVRQVRNWFDGMVSSRTLTKGKLALSDIGFDNILVEDSGACWIIDLEYSLSAEKYLTLGYLEARYGTNLFSSKLISMFDLSYSERTYVDFYVILRLLRLIEYTDQLLPNGQKRDNILSFLPGARTVINNLTS